MIQTHYFTAENGDILAVYQVFIYKLANEVFIINLN